MPDHGDRFEGTARYYAAHRPEYGTAAVDYLVDRFDLDGGSTVLDLGCGTGQLALPLAAYTGRVVAMDPNESMLAAARERAEASAEETAYIEWVAGSDADLHDGMGPFRLTTMGRSFHWMDGRATLDRLQGLTEPGGGVAMLTDDEWLTKGRADWMAATYEVAADYLADPPERVDPATVSYDDPWDGLLAERGFSDVEVVAFDVDREWSSDGIVGYVRSLSFCSPERFGDDVEAFEADLRERLAALGGGPFQQSATVEVVSGRG